MRSDGHRARFCEPDPTQLMNLAPSIAPIAADQSHCRKGQGHFKRLAGGRSDFSAAGRPHLPGVRRAAGRGV